MKVQIEPMGEPITTGKVNNRQVQPRNSDFVRLLGQKSDSLQNRQNAPEECEVPQSGAEKNAALVKLGTVTKRIPTVSDLLIRHSEFKKDCWRIVHSKQNRSKSYTRIPPGTDIYINPETLELVWNEKGSGDSGLAFLKIAEASPQAVRPKTNTSLTESENTFSGQLVEVVKSYIGKPYSEMNCYEMVVEGLKTIGVRYRGVGGLAERLKEMAVQKGVSPHTYFNGEGLIKASGASVYSKTVLSVKDSRLQTEKIMKELEPLLEKGMLLSFSTTSRGHTGVISKKDQMWTFINSGWMDHNIENGIRRKAVGEETLGDEIGNWLKLAASRKEPLQITVGRFQKKQLEAFLQNRPLLSRTV